MADSNIKKEETKQVILTGFGGQGIIMAGRILGMAAALVDQKESTLVQSYGPESRGGACCAQVIISTKVIQYPYVKSADVLMCMSQSAYDKYKGQLKAQGFLVIDKDLVTPDDDRLAFSIAATRMAEEMGRKMMANIIMVGFTTAVTRLVTENAARQAVLSSVPKGTGEMNLKAFTKGYEYGLATLKGQRKKAAGRIGATA
jgi:2-oxoglutarate ferredoxin oxidoreductase subunit gamma